MYNLDVLVCVNVLHLWFSVVISFEDVCHVWISTCQASRINKAFASCSHHIHTVTIQWLQAFNPHLSPELGNVLVL